MRNGNLQSETNPCNAVLSSYPTYEEWKLNNNFFVSTSLTNCSYPTYEEWKLSFSIFTVPRESQSSYPTYEEWKLYTWNKSMYFVYD